jgi:prevent-host-death family protein
METITIQKAKMQLSRLIKKACQGEEIVIARGSKPVVRLVAIKNQNDDREPGAWKGRSRLGLNFLSPCPRKS